MRRQTGFGQVGRGKGAALRGTVRRGGTTLDRRRWRAARWTVALSVAWGFPTASGAQEPALPFPVSSSLPAEARQFDFWVGEWDVNLRVRQPDGSWADQHRATAHIYPILNGKAVLELWSEDRVQGIKGFSLRAYDPAAEEWALWLNWPQPNQGVLGRLTGAFRHGRGEFFNEFPGQDGETIRARYTFSDVGPDRLRWDDAYTRDGGQTWSNNWIMEFSRRAELPVLSTSEPAPTFHQGGRCDAPEFRRYEFLEGRHAGQVEAGGQGPVTITGHRVLDGCAVLTFAGADGSSASAWGFSHLNWAPPLGQYELLTLTSQPGTPIRRFVTVDPQTLVFYEQPLPRFPADPESGVDRFRVEPLEGGGFLWVHETPGSDGWEPVWQGRFVGN